MGQSLSAFAVNTNFLADEHDPAAPGCDQRPREPGPAAHPERRLPDAQEQRRPQRPRHRHHERQEGRRRGHHRLRPLASVQLIFKCTPNSENAERLIFCQLDITFH